MIGFILKGNGVLPSKGSTNAAGYDIRCVEQFTLEYGQQKLIKTGVFLAQCPLNVYLRVAPRSKLANKHGIDVMAGVIDADYRGEICVILRNHSNKSVRFERHDAIAQLIPEMIAMTSVREVSLGSTTERGEAGINDGDARR